MSEEYLLPVTVKDVNGQLVADCNSGCFIHAFAVDKKVLKSADDLRKEGAEQMRNACLRLMDMSEVERYKLLQINNVYCIISGCKADQIIELLRAHDTAARAGQIWESKEGKDKVRVVIINPRFDGEINYIAFLQSIFITGHEPPCDFYEQYQNTGEVIDLEKDNVFAALKGERNE